MARAYVTHPAGAKSRPGGGGIRAGSAARRGAGRRRGRRARRRSPGDQLRRDRLGPLDRRVEPLLGGAAAQLAEALTEIQDAYQAGQDALKAGDFAAYGTAQKQLDAAIKKAQAIAPQLVVNGATPTPSPSGSATPSPSPSTTASPTG